jgi:L-amino acid N-acyltransferase YncA
MYLLADTNIIISIDPLSPTGFEERTTVAADLSRLVLQGGHSLLVHPASENDLIRDSDIERRQARMRLLNKYPILASPPAVDEELEGVVGHAAVDSNDWVDHQLLAAIKADAADYLVTDDDRLIRKARRAGLRERVVTVAEAVATLRGLFDRPPQPPPAVQPMKAYQLDERDPIFEGLRQDYVDFDAWLSKCKREHRDSWVVPTGEGYAGIAIVKRETSNELALGTNVLKLSTIKVSPNHRGKKYGELLLKTIFDYRRENAFDHAYVTVFEKHHDLLALLEDFGFELHQERTPIGELIYIKTFRPDAADGALDPLTYHVRLGPPAIKLEETRMFLVPIQPGYHRMLFPDAPGDFALFDLDQPFGHALRKAYLCNAPIRALRPGDTMLFYRSQDAMGIRCIGVVEETLVSADPAEIARAVGRRTVYSYAAIESMCQREVLAILFRQDRILPELLTVGELARHGVLLRPPQSIMSVREEGREWLANRLRE